MFSQRFLTDMILPVAQSQPTWIAETIRWAVHVVKLHEWIYNGLFAAIQLVIGFWLMVGFRVKTALVGAIVWTVIVWWFGEGFGQLATGQALLLTGAPGAVVLYALVGLAIWPSDNGNTAVSPRGRMLARWSLGLIWILGGALQFQSSYRNPTDLSQVFSTSWVSHLVIRFGPAAIIALCALQLALGMAILVDRRTNTAACVSIAVSLLIWWTAQGFGQLFSGMATDPNAGPLMVLLALCTWSVNRRSPF